MKTKAKVVAKLSSNATDETILELASLATMANTFVMTGVDTTDTTMDPTGTNKKVAPIVMASYLNFGPVGAKIATTSDFTAAQTAGVKVMNFVGNNIAINLGSLTITDSLTIYLSPGAGFSHENITVNAGASLNIISFEKLAVVSGGFPSGNNYIRRLGTISGAGFLYAKSIYSCPFTGAAFGNILSHTEDCTIIDSGSVGTGLNLTISGSISIRDTVSTLMPSGTANVLTIGKGCTAVSPQINLNNGGSAVQVASVAQGGILISPYCTSLSSSSSSTIANAGTTSNLSNDTNTTTTVNTSGTGIFLDSSSPSLAPTAAQGTNTKQIATTEFVNTEIATLAGIPSTNAQTGTAYTLQDTDKVALVTLNNAAAVTLTLPQQSTLTTATNYFCAVENIGAGTVTIVKEGAETLIGNTTLLPGTQCVIRRPTTTSWSVFGGSAIVNMSGLPFIIQTATNTTITLVAYCGCPVTFLGLAEKAGSLTTPGARSIAINGTPITGLSAVAVTTTGTYTAATALNKAVRGDAVTVTYSGTLAVTNDSLLLDYTQDF